MEEQIIEQERIFVSEEDHVEVPKFKGYSLNQLRYQRALIALQREFAKEKAIRGINRLKNHNPFSGNKQSSSSGKWRRASSFLLSIASNLNYLDYARVGLSLFTSARKIFSIFNGRKKKS